MHQLDFPYVIFHFSFSIVFTEPVVMQFEADCKLR